MSEHEPNTPEQPPIGKKYYSKQKECKLIHPSSALGGSWENETLGLQGMRLEVIGYHPDRQDMALCKIQYPKGWGKHLRQPVPDLFRAGPQVTLPNQGYTETLEEGQRWVLLSDLSDENKFGEERRETSSPDEMSTERAKDLLENSDAKIRYSDSERDVMGTMRAAHRKIIESNQAE